MKKLLTILLTFILVIGLGACAPSQDTKELEDRIEILEEQMLEVEDILVNIEVIEGLNGQREYYIPSTSTVSKFVGVSASDVEPLGDALDKTKAPDYVLDINEEYISFEQVAQLLVDKYFENNVLLTSATIGFQIKLVLDVGDITQSEYLARLALMIEELSNYDFYIIGGSEILIQTVFGGTSYIIIPVQTLRSSFITITPEVIYTQTYEVRIFNMTYDDVLVQQYYDDFVLNETFIGYVLDYKE